MIQRIQSIFLLLAAGALTGQFALPCLQTPADNAARNTLVLADGALTPMDNVGMLGLTVLGIAVSLAAIFLYKNRPLQGRLVLGALGAALLLQVLVGITVKTTLEQVAGSGSAQMGPGVGLPLAAAVLCWMAARSIRKDEALVRSMDRLR